MVSCCRRFTIVKKGAIWTRWRGPRLRHRELREAPRRKMQEVPRQPWRRAGRWRILAPRRHCRQEPLPRQPLPVHPATLLLQFAGSYRAGRRIDDNNGPLTPALSPSEGAREKHRLVAGVGYVKDSSVAPARALWPERCAAGRGGWRRNRPRWRAHPCHHRHSPRANFAGCRQR